MIAWVIGRGGLLGSSVEEEIASSGEAWWPATPIAWLSMTDFRATIESAIGEFATHVEASPTSDWAILWCAGVGVVASEDHVFDDETEKLEIFLELLEGYRSRLPLSGALFFASSAGAVYAGSSAPPFTESSGVAPIGAYGAHKLECELMCESFARKTRTKLVVGRITNLYGPGQNQDKRQGLLTAACVSMVTRQPIFIYVPLETRRNFIYAPDAGRMIVACITRSLSARGADPAIKIVGSDANTSISQLLFECARVFNRKPRVVSSIHPSARLQPRDLRMKSIVWPDLDRFTFTGLARGMAIVRAGIERDLQLGAFSALAGSDLAVK